MITVGELRFYRDPEMWSAFKGEEGGEVEVGMKQIGTLRRAEGLH